MNTLLLAAALLQQPLPDFPREWVVQDYLRPVLTPGVPGFFWEATASIGDPDGDGLPSVVLDGRSWAPGQVLDRTTLLQESLFFDNPREWTRPQSPIGLMATASERPTSALLARTGGEALVLADHGNPGRLEIRDPASGALLGVALGPSNPSALAPAGDLDGDGQEDFFAWYLPQHVAAYSGASGAELWRQTVLAATQLAHPVQALAGAPPDLDGDGRADALVVGVRAQYPLATKWKVVALSGLDGTPLWSVGGTQGDNDAPYLAQGLDFTGDGVPDAAFVSGDTFGAVDGATGALLWQRTRSWFSPWLTTPRLDDHALPSPQLTRSPADPQKVEFVMPYFELTNIGPWESRYFLFHLDAATGDVLAQDLLPETLAPFDPWAMTTTVGWPKFQPLGDVDRDGLAEYAFSWGLPYEMAQGYGTGYSALVFLGLRTLDPPPALSLSRPVLVRVALPSAAGRVCQLRVASAYDPAGGARTGPWRSYLADDPLLAWSGGPGLAQATLDASGQAVVAVSLPPSPALAGLTLAVRAQVPDPSGLWTQSTFHLLPTGP